MIRIGPFAGGAVVGVAVVTGTGLGTVDLATAAALTTSAPRLAALGAGRGAAVTGAATSMASANPPDPIARRWAVRFGQSIFRKYVPMSLIS